MGSAVRTQRIGNMRERITLQRLERTPDGGGGFEETFVDVASVWARVEPVKSSEQFMAGGIQGIDDLLVHIRHRDDVNQLWRMIWRDRQLSITGIRNLDERRQFLTIDATNW